jgi:hypothetical protein
MERDPDGLCMAMAREQQSLFTLIQARHAGLNDSAIHHRVETGRLERFLPGVLAVPGVSDSWERDLTGLQLMYGDGSAGSHRAAARIIGFDGFWRAPVELSTTNRKRFTVGVRSGRRPIIHRVDSHLLAEIIRWDGMLITSPRRTILDLCAIRSPRAESVLDETIRRRLSDIGSLSLFLEQEWMRGRRGVGILRRLLIPRLDGQAPTDSEMELLALKRIDEARLPAPVPQHPVTIPSGDIKVDLAYPKFMLAIELDGYAWHMDRNSFERDRQRDNELRALGWTVLRFTWAVVRYEPGRMTDLIAHLQRAASPPFIERVHG